ncbi:MAG TPA: hypothetical protein DCQ06_05875 [Myxococcales bacterium]|nr:hypothetical protein [Myxococcales bacterium]HAN31109.1 hypothetical protein [Myxococcales bacterium]
MNTALTDNQRLPLELVYERHRPLVQVDRDVSIRLRVAKGQLPSSLGDLVPTLTYLISDPDIEVRREAIKTLSDAPETELSQVLSGPQSSRLLEILAQKLTASAALVAIALNSKTVVSTLVDLAGRGDAQVCDVIGRNAQRALDNPSIIEALFFNPLAPQGSVQNLMELAVREGLPLDHMPGFVEIREDLLGQVASGQSAAPLALTDIDFLNVVELATNANDGQVTGGKAFEEQEEVKRSLQAMIMNMSVAEKIRLALIGDANARKLLIRDPKKMVSLAVLKSPRLTDGEIRLFAANKNVADEVISSISRNRTWTRDYMVRKALVMNPKTKLTAAMGFMRTLIAKDIKSVSKSREVSTVVARAAKTLLEKIEMGKKKKKKK